ncbi:MAG TPA: nuclear transport factor 2 family protein [Bryobacteraceae bacterium]|nr:nuclear transport factor 2 family protein [Bryobacteraceae bacterium]
MSTSAIAVRGTASQSELQDYDAIVNVMNRYNEGVRTGSSAMMKPAFHEAATLFGYIEGKLLAGSIQMLFDWVDGNGSSNDKQSRIVSVAVHQTIAVVGEASLVPSHQLVSNGLGSCCSDSQVNQCW